MHPIDHILQRILRELEQSYRAAQEKFGDVLKATAHFLKGQLDLFPQRIRNAAKECRKFKDHPHIATKTVKIPLVMGVFAAVLQVILPPIVLSILRLVGFGASGPVAGSAAAAFQSFFYGGNTHGFFSFLQSISMTGNIQGVVTFLSSIAAAIGGLMVVMGGEIKKLVGDLVRRAIEILRSIF